jgi:hypothetical protein
MKHAGVTEMEHWYLHSVVMDPVLMGIAAFHYALGIVALYFALVL